MSVMFQKKESKFTGKRAFLWFGGFFLVIFAVNGIMIYLALGTWSGLDTKNAYGKGLYYNDEIAAAKAQRRSGWEIFLTRRPDTANGGRLNVTISWPQGDLPPAKVIARLSRPVTNRYDHDIVLTKTATNIYSAPLELPLAGQWDLAILVKRPEGPIYQLHEKIFISESK